MKNLFEPAAAAEVKTRIRTLRPDSQRLWGKMSVAQALAHCAASMEMALGDQKPPRMLIGWLIGGTIKRFALRGDKPMERNSPTAPSLYVRDERDFEIERQRLVELVDRFATGGAAATTAHPHSFFGRLTSDEWAILMYKHLDHHLQQFGV